MMLRNTDIMKRDWIGPNEKPDVIVVTYRTRRAGSGLPYFFKTVVFAGAYDCTILDWNSEAEAIKGHEQTLARVKRGEPVYLMAH